MSQLSRMKMSQLSCITDSKEDDYKYLVQWKDNTISDASWITSHDPLHYAPRLHSDFFLYMKDTSSEMKSSNLGGIDRELFHMLSLDPMVSYAGPGRALVKMSAN